jgi:hypothetical protein
MVLNARTRRAPGRNFCDVRPMPSRSATSAIAPSRALTALPQSRTILPFSAAP